MTLATFEMSLLLGFGAVGFIIFWLGLRADIKDGYIKTNSPLLFGLRKDQKRDE